ncbi:hypothetical protein GLW07_12395 [Bacillus hwajinpoensis]|uniref:Uncharacterized protein n=1 Tax=Guptibacillus hwajinpoensis TaxID=208199 RepID=A0A845F000_9BACL|nr:hypothetical protein [Pseudalkalibacillus hwajinpoensis]MYL64153.1 hypothetical protein [Pseudalkalibacillus hwajinpoensis]
MNYKKRNNQKGKGKTATVMALSALGGAAAYALTNRMQNGGFSGMQQHSQQNSSHQAQSHSQHQSPESLKQMASAQGIDNDAIAEFTNAIKDDLR